jgi:hypothetical protein
LTFSNHIYYNCKVTTDDGQEFLIDANWMHNENLDHWQGWICNAGKDRIYIDSDLDVHSGMCKNDQLGNILTGWDILTDATTCNRLQCTGCTDDLIQHKREKR